ncbi:hypothetical protein BN946_scf184909.g43 [Trametes cinnabarina]|uniref:protein-serine/threonine phosphatase n=1 Tax=Pycnoporus cinnabarinus TaxID=5643 RepID=A0A060SGU3_PYCCI|nr:hypothetical protein BN946_scf184909.g43 [Trametes cinnabarina]
MGQTLSIPAMEDAHTAVLDLDGEPTESNTFFAVYDGHGGSAVAKYAGQHLHQRLVADEAYRQKDYPRALKNAFLGTDEDIRSNPDFARDGSGCTAVAALVTKEGRIYVANAGDSRSVISIKGEAKQLSYDHKPQNETEKNRIVAAGGYIEYGRVNGMHPGLSPSSICRSLESLTGNLALARALGDFDYKKNAALAPEAQIITSDPEVIEHDITEEDEFIIIACDGIWDCLTSQQAVNVVRLLISQGRKLPEICEEICELCLAPDTTTGAGIGCDNMTVMIVALLHGRSEEEWYNWITERVKNKYGYPTPETLPQLYSTSRLMSFKVKREAYEARRRERLEREERERSGAGNSGEGTTSLVGGLANILGGDGSLVLHTAPDDDDDDDDDSDDDDADSHGINARSLLGSTGFGLGGRTIQLDMTRSLREQLQELDAMGAFGDNDVEMDEDEHELAGDGERDGHGETEHPPSDPESPTYTQNGSSSQGSRGGETPPPPPTPPPNGDATPKQLNSLPGGDEPHPAVVAEGFLDSSESPLKV